jgi:hypothetical protein
MRWICLSVSIAGIAELLSCAPALADPAPFDLTGPSIEMEVTRGTSTLPVSHVPNLAPGDRVWMKAALSAGQSTHYLMVVALLRGSTDPPPVNWFFRCNTWTGKCAREGITLTVPKGARQMLVFLAPETGGDFKTLVNAVRGRPGAFVRTSQELNQAALEHLRLEAYLDAIRNLAQADPARLKEVAPLLSRSLAIKVDEKCLDRIPALQAPCLMQGQESLIMTDGHSASMAQELTSGPASDLAIEAVNTPLLKSGYYGPFIGSLLDIARLFDSFHTAQYQYIPALASAQGRELKLALNTPPSFHDPKSVLVAALPAVEPAKLPSLRPVDPKETYCVRKDPLILPVEGASLVFAGAYAHGMMLSLPEKGGTTIRLPASADPSRGGFAIDTSSLSAVALDSSAPASIEGEWGFDKYEGPSFQLVDTRKRAWELGMGDEAALIVGREDTIHLTGGSAQCTEEIALRDSAGKDMKVEWRGVRPEELDLKLFLQQARPGDMTLIVRQYGGGQPQQFALHAYAEAGHLESFEMHAGDHQGILHGKRLDEVDRLIVRGVEFVPGALSTSDGRDELSMSALKTDGAIDLRSGETAQGRVTLKDGRALDVTASVEPPRPSAILIGKSAQLAPSGHVGNIRLASLDELPQNATLTFSLRAAAPPAFAHGDKIEVATIDGSSSTVLDVENGALTLQNVRVAVATLDPAKALGASAFGPLRFRRVVNAVAGDWRPLGTLVRLPLLTDLRCPETSGTGCTLSGANLFLLDSVSGDSHFGQPIQVPDGFTGTALSVPRPLEARLYLKLRDDPTVVSVATLDMPEAAASRGEVPRKPDSNVSVETQAASRSDSGETTNATVASPSLPARRVPTAEGSMPPPASSSPAMPSEPPSHPVGAEAKSPEAPQQAGSDVGAGHSP